MKRRQQGFGQQTRIQGVGHPAPGFTQACFPGQQVVKIETRGHTAQCLLEVLVIMAMTQKFLSDQIHDPELEPFQPLIQAQIQDPVRLLSQGKAIIRQDL